MIKKHFLLSILILLTSTICISQKVFPGTTSKKFDTKVEEWKCIDKICTATIKIFKQNSTTPFQEFRTAEITEGAEVLLDDFNFDGMEDIAIPNGFGGYGIPSFDVYVYNSIRNRFIKNAALTKLASQQGMFELDKKRKRIISYSKSGCCWHRTKEYEVVANKGLVLVYDKVEDASNSEEHVVVTEKKLSKGKWSTTTKKYRTQDYYKDE